MAQNALKTRILRHDAAHFAPILIFLSAFERAQCPLSNESKMKQFGQEMAELWPKTARARTYMCQKVGDFTAYHFFRDPYEAS